MADDNQKSGKPSKEKPDAKLVAKPEAKPVEKQDVVLMHSRTDDGEGIRVIRSREGRVEAGELRAVKEGAPVSGEVVSLRQRPEHPMLWDVDVQYRARKTKAHAGPVRVTSRAYRDNWDSIFKSRKRDVEDEPVLN